LGIQSKAAWVDRLAECFTKTASLSQAKVAKEMMKRELFGEKWVRGIGIGKSPEGKFTVRINVASEADLAKIPKMFGGVPVDAVVIGEIRPQR